MVLKKSRKQIIMTGSIGVTQHIGIEKHYQLGLSNGLAKNGVDVEQISNDEMMQMSNPLHERIRLINLRGDQNPKQKFFVKLLRIIRYYNKLFIYAIKSKNKLFHIHTENKFIYFDRTLLILFYKMLGKIIILTVHNVDGQARSGKSSLFNRLTLKYQYYLSDHLIVHTEKMKEQLIAGFGVSPISVSVIPIGINDQVPSTGISKQDARAILHIPNSKKVLLFFGNIDPYKGLDVLLHAFKELRKNDPEYFLIIAGRPKGNAQYFTAVKEYIIQNNLESEIYSSFQFIPDNDIERYFAAADCLILPYKNIYQSAVLVLGYSFGLPVIGTRVGNFENDILEGKTGFVCEPNDYKSLGQSIQNYFTHNLFKQFDKTRIWISQYSHEKYSWNNIGAQTKRVYQNILH